MLRPSAAGPHSSAAHPCSAAALPGPQRIAQMLIFLWRNRENYWKEVQRSPKHHWNITWNMTWTRLADTSNVMALRSNSSSSQRFCSFSLSCFSSCAMRSKSPSHLALLSKFFEVITFSFSFLSKRPSRRPMAISSSDFLSKTEVENISWAVSSGLQRSLSNFLKT